MNEGLIGKWQELESERDMLLGQVAHLGRVAERRIEERDAYQAERDWLEGKLTDAHNALHDIHDSLPYLQYCGCRIAGERAEHPYLDHLDAAVTELMEKAAAGYSLATKAPNAPENHAISG
jgi:hypothetical protein